MMCGRKSFSRAGNKQELYPEKGTQSAVVKGKKKDYDKSVDTRSPTGNKNRFAGSVVRQTSFKDEQLVS